MPDGHRWCGRSVEALGAPLQSQSRDQRITRGKTNGQERGKDMKGEREKKAERSRQNESENTRREEKEV